MPILELEQLKKLVIQKEIDSLTIDTSTVEQHQYGFEVGVLATLDQFSRRDFNFLLTDIVIDEMASHLQAQAELVRSQVKNKLKPLGNSWGVTDEVRSQVMVTLFGNETAELRTNNRITDFVAVTAATVLTTGDMVNIKEVLHRYKEILPPFGTKSNKQGSKKHEFPDAIALLALEKWAEDNDTNIAIVSNDGDWKRFCAQSDCLYYVATLSQGLSIFQTDANDIANYFRDSLVGGTTEDIEDYLVGEIESQIDNIDINFEAASSFQFEAELTRVSFSTEKLLSEQIRNFGIINFENDTLTVESFVQINVQAEFVANFQHWDSIDREYLGMGSTELQESQVIEVQLLITLDFQDGEINFQEVELISNSVTIDLGEIEPDWMHSDRDNELDETPEAN